MMKPLTVEHLTKYYPAFSLEDVSFQLEPGKITGFIGRNGAGKSTTLKSLLNIVHPDSGSVTYWGQPFAANEREIKEKIGFVAGGVSFYPKKKLKVITDVTRRFYDRWDDAACRRFCDRFELDEDKTPSQLSAGMQVKYALALALSHRAELLILDEPTSGLDPVSRSELLEVFLSLAQDEGVTILFSTHITTDLDRCADRILYLRKGRLVFDVDADALRDQYHLVHLPDHGQAAPLSPILQGVIRERDGISALVRSDAVLPADIRRQPATLEDIYVHLEQEVSQ